MAFQLLNSPMAYKLMQSVKNGDSNMIHELLHTESMGEVGLKIVKDVSMRDLYTIMQVVQAFYKFVLPMAKKFSQFKSSEVKNDKKVAASKTVKRISSKVEKKQSSKTPRSRSRKVGLRQVNAKKKRMNKDAADADKLLSELEQIRAGELEVKAKKEKIAELTADLFGIA